MQNIKAMLRQKHMILLIYICLTLQTTREKADRHFLGTMCNKIDLNDEKTAEIYKQRVIKLFVLHYSDFFVNSLLLKTDISNEVTRKDILTSHFQAITNLIMQDNIPNTVCYNVYSKKYVCKNKNETKILELQQEIANDPNILLDDKKLIEKHCEIALLMLQKDRYTKTSIANAYHPIHLFYRQYYDELINRFVVDTHDFKKRCTKQM